MLLNLKGEPRVMAVQAIAPKPVAPATVPAVSNAKSTGPAIKKPTATTVAKPVADKVITIFFKLIFLIYNNIFKMINRKMKRKK